MKKRMLLLILALSLLLTGCAVDSSYDSHSSSAKKSKKVTKEGIVDISQSEDIDIENEIETEAEVEAETETVTQPTAQVTPTTVSEYLSAQDARYVYYSDDTGIYKRSKSDGSVQKLLNEMYVGEIKLYRDRLYYLYGSDTLPTINSLHTDGTDHKTLVNINDLEDGSSLHSWTIYGNKLYIQMGFGFYQADLTGDNLTRLHGDVAEYAFHGNDLYLIDHAMRTFSIYKLNLTTGEITLIRGTGEYREKGTSKELYSNVVVNESGEIFYTKRVPYGLYTLVDGTDQLILASDQIDEYSLCYEDGLYYVIKENEQYVLRRYDPDKRSTVSLCALPNYQGATAMGIKNGYFYYRDSDLNFYKVSLG